MKFTEHSSAQGSAYHLSIFLSHILLYALWYITCTYWWKYGILVLFAGSIYKLLIFIFFSIELPIHLGTYPNLFIAIGSSFILFIVSRKINYPFRYQISNNHIDADSILRYRTKNISQYKNFLNHFMGVITTKEINNAQELIANAILISDDEKTNTENKIEGKNYSLKSKILGILIIIVIFMLPIIDRIYYIAPNSNVWNLGWITLTTSKYNNFAIFFWLLTYMYLTMSIGLTIWFFTSKYWWKYFLLVPIVLSLYEIISVLNVDQRYIHENEIWQALPVLSMITLFLVWISFKIDNHTQIESIKEQIKIETFKVIESLADLEKEKKINHHSIKIEINAIISNKKSYEPKEYLEKLETLYAKLSALK
ncbi:hypothetical protein HX109_14850 [Galbibacter sp. BG1]|uniref:hypothetical protein n=1 Tax=Galbibacter sp. BG1 TaxID=1170699 RepID=UPI0015BC146D|nr:hypothetical protein [Galbibacter sp. BG1]QLE02780.1 hypothetical protein HX109_14850 [Galbibacter sp. BG1]